jgi:para-aminobenzoate synthetase/4-amino-4-deoxychorismate lyase
MHRFPRSPYIRFDSDRPEAGGHRALRFERPVRILRLDAGVDVRRFFDDLERALAGGLWAAGYFAYELGYLFEKRLAPLLHSRRPPGPLAWIGLFEEPVASVPEEEFGSDGSPGRSFVSSLRLNTTRGEYVDSVERIRSHLADGETYQVNFTMKYRFDLNGSPEALYESLRRRQRVSYAAYVLDGERAVISLSPELFLRRDGDTIRVKPMKGTARRGGGLEDEELAAWLAADAKNRAENVMIVDMVRNDLGRISPPGGVRVPQIFEIERYETLFQMTSTVEADVPREASWFDVMRTLFPCASVTGAPKVRTMELIAGLEKEPRGVYTGSIGYISPEGNACFNVAIRTIVVDRTGVGEMGVGSGVVYDSDPLNEFDECLLKAEFLSGLRPDFELVETMLLEDGRWWLLDRHLSRLEASAAHFGFLFSRARVQSALDEAGGVRPSGRHRVRLLLNAGGETTVSAEAVRRPPHAWRVRLSRERVDPADQMLRHKTTDRPLYARERDTALADGFDEALFLNTRGEVTEGTITNLFVENGGTLITPPVASGLLPGTLREELIDRGECEERVLYPDDLRSARRVYVGNAVHGLVPAELDM